MKSSFIAAIIACSFLMAACSGGSSEQEKGAVSPDKTGANASAEKPAGLSDPADVALRFLNAFKSRDMETLKNLSTPIMKSAAWGDESAVKRIFDSWGGDVAKWDGKIKEVRYVKDGMPYEMAVAYFTDSTAKIDKELGNDKIITVSFSHVMGPDWGFETFSSRDRKEFLGMSTTSQGK